MANTYVAIATTTVGSGGAANIEFTSIPQTYTDLLLVSSLRGSQNGATLAGLALNGSTASFTGRYIYGDGQSTVSLSDGGNVVNYATGISVTANAFTNAYSYIPNYTSSNYKSISSDVVLEQNQSTNAMFLSATLWSNTAAITSLSLNVSAGTFAQYSTATLYGIKNS